jgi:hypothetical protein
MGNARRVKRKSCTLHLAFLLITVEMEKWQFYFYFKGGEIGGYSGVQVGIWGDTKEINFCSGFGFYGWHFSPD